LRHSYLRKRLVLVAGMLALPLLVYVLPSLDALTGGKLSERYVDISGTNRELIARQQFDVFRRHPITGVGPGRSFEEVIGRAATHTEFTRLLSEHGMFGATALVVLLTALLKRYRQKRGEGAKTTVGACVLWGLAAMAGYATRLTATSFVLGLAFARFEERNATAHRPGGSNCVEERFGSLGLPCNATRA
ncbi:MAG: O-antigen ligase family protein, partial [Armatimonadota bacterium]